MTNTSEYTLLNANVFENVIIRNVQDREEVYKILNGACLLVHPDIHGKNILYADTPVSHCKDSVYIASWEKAIKGEDIVFLLFTPEVLRKRDFLQDISFSLPDSKASYIKVLINDSMAVDALLLHVNSGEYIHPTYYWAVLEHIRYKITGYTKNEYYYLAETITNSIVDNLTTSTIFTNFPNSNYSLYAAVLRVNKQALLRRLACGFGEDTLLLDVNYMHKIRELYSSGHYRNYFNFVGMSAAVWYSTPQSVMCGIGELMREYYYNSTRYQPEAMLAKICILAGFPCLRIPFLKDKDKELYDYFRA